MTETQKMNCIKSLQMQIEQALIGKQDVIEYVLIALLAEGHILIEDMPGVGKTTLASALAGSISCSFGRIQCTPDTLPGDILGISLYNMESGQFHYQKGPLFHNILLVDELNRTSPKTQAALLEAMQERQVTVDGVSHVLEDPFMVIATQNPLHTAGTYPLPEAELDRFMMKLSIGYPSKEYEEQMVASMLARQYHTSVSPVLSKEDLQTLTKETMAITIHPELITYMTEIVRYTRQKEEISLGASPRALLSLCRAAQACAYLRNRNYVTPSDIKHVAIPVLAHRIVLTFASKSTGLTEDKFIKEVLCKITVPVL